MGMGSNALAICAAAVLLLPATACAAPSSPAPRTTQLPAKTSEPLGDPGLLSIAPGTLLPGDNPLRALAPDEASRWQAGESISLKLKNADLGLTPLELPGEGAAVVLASSDGRTSRVVTTYSAYQGGSGAEITIRNVIVDPSRVFGLVLLELVRESRAYVADPGDAASGVEASVDHSWIVLGVAADRAWLASDELVGFASVALKTQGPRLTLLGCRLHGQPPASWVLDAGTAMMKSTPTRPDDVAACGTAKVAH